MGDEDEQLTGIAKPHDHDVLSGRGNFVNHHAGNENFRKLWVNVRFCAYHVYKNFGMCSHVDIILTLYIISLCIPINTL